MIILSTRAKNLILPNRRIKRLIAESTGRTEGTVHEWVKNDSPLITQAAALVVIRKETGLSDSDILMEAS